MMAIIKAVAANIVICLIWYTAEYVRSGGLPLGHRGSGLAVLLYFLLTTALFTRIESLKATLSHKDQPKYIVLGRAKRGWDEKEKRDDPCPKPY